MDAVRDGTAAAGGVATDTRGGAGAPWDRLPLARSTGRFALPIGLLLAAAAAPPGTYVPIALFALFFGLLVLPLWLYALASALRHGLRGLGARLVPLAVFPAVLLAGVALMSSHAFDRLVFRIAPGGLARFERELDALPDTRTEVEGTWYGPYAVRTMRIWGADRGLVQVELVMTRTFLSAAGLVRARDEQALAQLARIDPELETWPLGDGWFAYSGEALERRR